MRSLVFALALVVLVIGAAGCSSGVDSAEAEEACNSNLRTLEGAYLTYMAEEGVAPSGMQDLIPDYIKSEPVGPAGGEYSFAADGQAECTVHGTYDD